MILVLYIESNKTAKNNNINCNRITYKRDFESELRKCIDSWRLNAGRLKDIKILVFYSGLKTFYKNGDVDYIELKIEHNDYGFLNVHYAGLEAQKLFPDEDLLHIDLDMYIQKELPLFDSTTIGVYSKEDEPFQRKKIYGERLAETDFIFTPKGSDFYKNYFNYYNNIVKILKLKNIHPYDYEEYVADYILNKFKYNIFENYECGEGFHYKGDYYFWHEHLKI